MCRDEAAPDDQGRVMLTKATSDASQSKSCRLLLHRSTESWIFPLVLYVALQEKHTGKSSGKVTRTWKNRSD